MVSSPERIRAATATPDTDHGSSEGTMNGSCIRASASFVSSAVRPANGSRNASASARPATMVSATNPARHLASLVLAIDVSHFSRTSRSNRPGARSTRCAGHSVISPILCNSTRPFSRSVHTSGHPSRSQNPRSWISVCCTIDKAASKRSAAFTRPLVGCRMVRNCVHQRPQSVYLSCTTILLLPKVRPPQHKSHACSGAG